MNDHSRPAYCHAEFIGAIFRWNYCFSTFRLSDYLAAIIDYTISQHKNKTKTPRCCFFSFLFGHIIVRQLCVLLVFSWKFIRSLVSWARRGGQLLHLVKQTKERGLLLFFFFVVVVSIMKRDSSLTQSVTRHRLSASLIQSNLSSYEGILRYKIEATYVAIFGRCLQGKNSHYEYKTT